MKQFYETYYSDSECYKLWYNLQDDKKPNILSQIVSAVPTQLQQPEKEEDTFVSAVLTQITWTHHRIILSKTASIEEKIFYIQSLYTN